MTQRDSNAILKQIKEKIKLTSSKFLAQPISSHDNLSIAESKVSIPRSASIEDGDLSVMEFVSSQRIKYTK
jgi:hypothetical protein